MYSYEGCFVGPGLDDLYKTFLKVQEEVLRGRFQGTCAVIRVALLVRAKYVVGALHRVRSVLLLDRLVGPVVKVSGSRAADPAEERAWIT